MSEELVVTEEASEDQFDFDTTETELDKILAGSETEDSNEEESDDTKTEESEEQETVEQKTEEVVEEEEIKEAKDEYYTMDEILEKSEDIDAEFDAKRIEPGSKVEKLYKNFQRGFNKKYEDVANYRKELQSVADISGIKAEIEALKSKKETSMEDYFNKQKEIEKQRELEEEEALLPEEDRRRLQENRALKRTVEEMKEQLLGLGNKVQTMERDKVQFQVDLDIENAAKDNGLDLKKYRDDINYAIGNTWEQDKRDNREFTGVKKIIDDLSVKIKEKEASLYKGDNLDKYFDTDEGKALLEKKMQEKLDKLKSKKKSGGTVVTSSPKAESLKEYTDEVPADLNSENIMEYLSS